MPRDFAPSSNDVSKDGMIATLQYLQKAAKAIETHLSSTETEKVPAWVESQIRQSATQLGMAVSYLSFAQTKKFQPSPVTTPAEPAAPNPSPKRKKS